MTSPPGPAKCPLPSLYGNRKAQPPTCSQGAHHWLSRLSRLSRAELTPTSRAAVTEQTRVGGEPLWDPRGWWRRGLVTGWEGLGQGSGEEEEML